MTSSWLFLSTLNYDARSTTHQINYYRYLYCRLSATAYSIYLHIPSKSEGSSSFRNLRTRHAVVKETYHDVYFERLTEMVPPPSQDTVTNCKQITLLILYNISSRLVILLKITDALNVSPIFFILLLVPAALIQGMISYTLFTGGCVSPQDPSRRTRRRENRVLPPGF